MDFEDGIVFSLRAVAIMEYVQRVLPVTRAPPSVFNRVRDVWVGLINNHIQLFVEEPLSGVCETPCFERVVLGDNRPLGKDLCVNVRRTSGVIAGVDTLKKLS